MNVSRSMWLLSLGLGCGNDGSTHILDAPEVACVPTGTPIMHSGSITADETWASGIHEVTSTVTVSGGTLTIAPCSEVRLAANASIELTPAATALIAEGTAQATIHFVRDVADAAWGHLSAYGPSRMSLAYVTLTGGGTAGDYKTAEQLGATLVARGDATLPAILHADHVTVDGSSGIGVFMNSTRFATGSTALTISHSASYPILLGADAASDLPDGIYTGNSTDEILLQSAGTAAAFEQGRTLLADVTIHDRGVPYRVGITPQSIVVGDGDAASPKETLTIEAGVTLKFTPEGNSGTSRLQVRGISTGVTQAALIVAGTAAKPVVFTSAAAIPAAGDWQGLELNNAIDPTTAIDHARIEDAGGPSYSRGVCEWKPNAGDFNASSSLLISLAANQVPPSAFVTNTAFSAGAGAGVYRGWNVADVDFLATNSFVAIAGCLETNVPNALNVCPTTTCPVN